MPLRPLVPPVSICILCVKAEPLARPAAISPTVLLVQLPPPASPVWEDIRFREVSACPAAASVAVFSAPLRPLARNAMMDSCFPLMDRPATSTAALRAVSLVTVSQHVRDASLEQPCHLIKLAALSDAKEASTLTQPPVVARDVPLQTASCATLPVNVCPVAIFTISALLTTIALPAVPSPTASTALVHQVAALSARVVSLRSMASVSLKLLAMQPTALPVSVDPAVNAVSVTRAMALAATVSHVLRSPALETRFWLDLLAHVGPSLIFQVDHASIAAMSTVWPAPAVAALNVLSGSIPVGHPASPALMPTARSATLSAVSPATLVSSAEMVNARVCPPEIHPNQSQCRGWAASSRARPAATPATSTTPAIWSVFRLSRDTFCSTEDCTSALTPVRAVQSFWTHPAWPLSVFLVLPVSFFPSEPASPVLMPMLSPVQSKMPIFH